LFKYRYFYKVYINDIIVFSKTFKEYVAYLKIILKLFKNIWLALSLVKFFYTYI
ncbi:hypothetical protein SODALDRAFT_253240, partial [Sodiomyces alkalinus F11]